MNSARKLLLLLPALVAACSVGVKVEDFKPAQGLQGVHVTLQLNGDVIEGNRTAGELLAVRDDGILLETTEIPNSEVAKRRVVLIPFWMMKTATLEQMGRVRVASDGKALDEMKLNRLRLVSRFPQGLSDELLAILLAELKQDQLDVPHRVK